MRNNEVREQVCKAIKKWYYSNIEFLSLISAPYNSCSIFKNIILEIINNGGRILYLWGESFENQKLIKIIDDKKCNYIYFENDGIGENNLIFSNYDNISEINGKYDLVIFDDISSFSRIDKKQLEIITKSLIKNSNKIIIFSVDEIKINDNVKSITYIEDNKPFLEPRLIKTRVDLNNDMPTILLEYIRWFISKKKKIVIYVPDEIKLSNVYEYYSKEIKSEIKHTKIIPIVRGEDKKTIKSVLMQKDVATIIITNSINESLDNSNVGSGIVLFADDEEYTYKKLLYLCGKLGKINNELPEMVFVAKNISKDIDAVKNITRGYNKFKWEKKLLSL
ncbi:MAG: hypothetical protein GX275_04105 [Clostridiales bacterium]|nr:hypothetical protein [Clostridiales bacterium]